jgi:hypothetical protein
LLRAVCRYHVSMSRPSSLVRQPVFQRLLPGYTEPWAVHQRWHLRFHNTTANGQLMVWGIDPNSGMALDAINNQPFYGLSRITFLGFIRASKRFTCLSFWGCALGPTEASALEAIPPQGKGKVRKVVTVYFGGIGILQTYFQDHLFSSTAPGGHCPLYCFHIPMRLLLFAVNIPQLFVISCSNHHKQLFPHNNPSYPQSTKIIAKLLSICVKCSGLMFVQGGPKMHMRIICYISASAHNSFTKFTVVIHN